MPETIAIIEDDPEVRKVLERCLSEFGFRTASHSCGSDFLRSLATSTPDLCILDLGLPDGDGVALMGQIRQSQRFPIIILSGRRDTSDRVIGLELGADDYIIKPFEPRELIARVRSALRRAKCGARPAEGAQSVRFEGYLFDIGAQMLVKPDGERIELGAAESNLLRAFIEAPNRVLSREYLLDKAGRENTLDRAIDVRVARLRKTLAQASDSTRLIRTVYGAGYMFTAKVEAG
ncbi:response regulator transcription factor [Pelagibius marinus]|uniref:response regulator transcription factor n=1 Tax=Pelagibius marinus TaxID=2762760 RepID=UPI001872260E|nr:response regulator transcription factor [Pelagibius marinus]